METGENSKKSSLNKTYFAKLHEKVHNKYEEMQRKLDKYKEQKPEVLGEELVNKERKKIVSNSNEKLKENKHKKLKQEHVTLQEVKFHEAVPQEIEQFVKYETEPDLSQYREFRCPDSSGSHNSQDPTEMPFIFPGNILNVSLESLTDESSIISNSPKIRLRHRIGSRITAAMEKRQRDISKKQEYKRQRDLSSSMETLVLSNTTTRVQNKMSKRARTATLTIALIEAKGLEDVISDDKSNEFYCRFRLGFGKWKSKSGKITKNKVKWLEMFTIPIHEEYILEITLWDREKQDVLLGRAVIDTSEIQKEKTHQMRIQLNGETLNVEIFLLLTISGTTLNTIIDIDDYKNTEQQMKIMKKNFAWYHLADDYGDVGCLSVLVYGAKGLAGDDPFCVLELGNTRLQTQTEYKTTDPNWMKTFVFTVTDITSILILSVYDETKKMDILGRISIPLLKINNSEKKWYALKDKTQRKKANGDYPRILLEMRVTWNPVKASIRVINPKEQVYLQIENKLSRHIFARNITRSRAIVSWLTDAIKVIKECFEWESRKDSFIALIVWLITCWFFQVWMLPAMFLVPFVWYRPQKYRFSLRRNKNELPSPDIPSDDASDKDEKEDKWSLRDKINTFQEMTLTVQSGIGTFASLGERVKNLVNFTVPYLSWLAIIILVTIAIVMYLIPVKYIFMAWAINKFTRKMLRPNRIPNNEILDLLSRVPDDEVLMDCEELPLSDLEDT